MRGTHTEERHRRAAYVCAAWDILGTCRGAAPVLTPSHLRRCAGSSVTEVSKRVSFNYFSRVSELFRAAPVKNWSDSGNKLFHERNANK